METKKGTNSKESIEIADQLRYTLRSFWKPGNDNNSLNRPIKLEQVHARMRGKIGHLTERMLILTDNVTSTGAKTFAIYTPS